MKSSLEIILSNGRKGTYTYVPYFVTDLGETGCRRSPRNSVEQFEFHENLCHDRYALMMGINERMAVLPICRI